MVQESYIYNGREIGSRIVMVYQSAPFLMTLNDPQPSFQGNTII